MTAPLPLKGLTVIAVEQAVAAPFCSARLADAGARVIKIERQSGDFARGYDDVARGQSSYFVWLNRGKESLVLDLTTLRDKLTLHRLLDNADILVQNLKPGSFAKLGFDLDHLAQKHPKLITCSISGYGEDGPFFDRKAYDLLIQADTGLASITGGPNEPSRVGISVVDIATGAAAYSAILEALLARHNTGAGAAISVAMFDVMAEWLTVPLLQAEGGKPPKRMGMAHPSIAPYGAFTAGDGSIFLISVQSEREWVQLCDIFLQQPGYATDKRFSTNLARVQNRIETDKLLQQIFATHTKATATDALQRANIAYAAVNDMADLSNHPHLRRISVSTESGTVQYPAPAPIFKDQPRNYGNVPAIGENKLSERTKPTK